MSEEDLGKKKKSIKGKGYIFPSVRSSNGLSENINTVCIRKKKDRTTERERE